MKNKKSFKLSKIVWGLSISSIVLGSIVPLTITGKKDTKKVVHRAGFKIASNGFEYDGGGSGLAEAFFTQGEFEAGAKVCYLSNSVDNTMMIVSSYGSDFTLLGVTAGTFVLASQVGDYKIVAIGDEAFTLSTSGGDWTLPDTIESIGYQAWGGQGTLKSIQFGSGLKTIGDRAFENTGLSQLSIPQSVTSIGAYAFDGCSLSTITFADYPELKTIGDSAFSSNAMSAFSLPSSVTSIGASAFSGCSQLITFSIPTVCELESIGASAFSNCSLLTSIVIPDSVQTIEPCAFQGCELLYSVTLPNNTQYVEISHDLFNDCQALTSITIPTNITHIDENAFASCYKLQNITFANPDGSWAANGINQNWLYGLSASSSITLHFYNYPSIFSYGKNDSPAWASIYPLIWCEDNVDDNAEQFFSLSVNSNAALSGTVYYTIGDNKTVTITGVSNDFVGKDVTLNSTAIIQGISGYTITGIGNNAFYDIEGLSGEIVLPSTLHTIGTGAFKNTNLTLVKFDGTPSISSIGEQAFRDCTNLEEIDLSVCNSLTSIGVNAFEDCASLKDIKLPTNSGYTTISDSLFYDCTSLVSITIPDYVTSIGSSAFDGCQKLSTIIWSDTTNLTQLGSEAFENCISLTHVTLPDNITNLGNSVFMGCTALTTVSLPDNINFTTIPDQAFCNTALPAITIPASVTYIGDNAFLACNDLNQFFFENDNGSWINYTPGGTAGINSDWLGKDTSTSRSIYVPAGSIKVYESNASSEWYSESSKVTFVPVAATVSASTFFSGATKGYVTYSILDETDETISIIGVDGIDSNVDLTLQSAVTINGTTWQVAKIVSNSFNKLTIQSLVIPASVQEIESTAFGGCSIGSLTFMGTLTIASQAFNGGTVDNLDFEQPVSMEENAFFITKITSTLTFASSYSNWVSNLPFWLNSPVDGLVVYVPEASYTQYKEALENCSWWASTWKVIPIDCNEIDADQLFDSSAANDVNGEVYYRIVGTNLIQIYATNNISCYGALIIKSTIQIGQQIYQLSSINQNAFYGNTEITDIDLSNQPIESIGDDAFNGCTSLSTVIFPDQLSTIGDRAFQNTNLYSVKLLSGIRTIGADAFADCSKLNSITFENRSWDWLDYGRAINNTWIDNSPVSTIYVHKDCIDGYRQYLEKYCLWYSQNPSIKLAPIEGEGNNLGLILGLSLGLGIPALAGIIFGIVYSVKRRKRY